LLQIGDGEVSARQVVNALGRWKTRHEWNDAGIGHKALIDDFRNGDYYDEDVQKMRTDFTKQARSVHYIARRPQFMDFCERYGLVARWVHRENVGSLPFPDDEAGRALAASVGATVEELNAEPVDETAADVVFDALSHTGMVGFADSEDVDRKRASFLTTDGGFNAETFDRSLAISRVNTASALSAVRVVPPLFAVGVGYHHLPQILEMSADFQAQIERNWAHHPWTFLLPVVPLVAIVYRAVTFVPAMERPDMPHPLTYQERAVLERDELYVQKMRLKKAGGLEEERVAKFDELFKGDESFTDKLLAGKMMPRMTRAKARAAAADSDEAADGATPLFGQRTAGASSFASDDEVLNRKVEIRSHKADGPMYYVGVAGVWTMVIALVGSVAQAALRAGPAVGN